MSQLPRILVTLGVALMIAGGVLLLAQKLGLGKLPGDLSWKGKTSSVHFPLATSLILSVVLTVLLNLWFGRR